MQNIFFAQDQLLCGSWILPSGYVKIAIEKLSFMVDLPRGSIVFCTFMVDLPRGSIIFCTFMVDLPRGSIVVCTFMVG